MEPFRNGFHVHVDSYTACFGYGSLGSNGSCLHGLVFRYSALNHLCSHSLGHCSKHTIVSVIGNALGEELVHVGTHIDGCIGSQPLISPISAECPLPTTVVLALDGQFFYKRVLQLLLLQVQIVLGKIVVVHLQIVAKILPGRHGVEHETLSVILYANSCIQYVALVRTGAVLAGLLRSCFQTIIGRCYVGICNLLFRYYLSVWKAILVYMLIVGNETKVQTLTWVPQQLCLSAKLVKLVGVFTVVFVREETILSSVESRDCQGSLVAQLGIMPYLCLTPELIAERELKVGTLIFKRILTVKTYQSALGVHSIECSLWSVKHVYTVYVVRMEIEGTLALYRHSVYIHSYSRRVYTRTYSAHIHSRGITRAIFGHSKRGNKSRELSEVLGIETVQLQTIKRSTVQWLLTQTVGFFRLVVDINFLNVVNPYSVVDFCLLLCHHRRWQKRCT